MESDPEFASRVKSILIEDFPPPDKVEVKKNDGLIGIVVSTRFEGLDYIDRQDLVWNNLDKKLTRQERREIAIIATSTPREEAGHLATELSWPPER